MHNNSIFLPQNKPAKLKKLQKNISQYQNIAKDNGWGTAFTWKSIGKSLLTVHKTPVIFATDAQTAGKFHKMCQLNFIKCQKSANLRLA